MCNRHSFVVTKDGKVLDGMGLTHSHTEIMTLHEIESAKHDYLNAYEWHPPKGWPEASYLEGLTVERQAFEPKASHDKAIAKYLKTKFPDEAAWDAPEAIDPALNGKTVTLAYGPFIVYCTGTHQVSEGRVRAFDSASVRAFDSASVEAFGSASVEAFDSASVEAFGSAHLVLGELWSRDVTAQVFDKAVVIDRLGGGISVYSAAELVECVNVGDAS